MHPGKAVWITTGYELFAYRGIENLKIERLALLTGVSKSSFYHHFADMDIFMGCLLDWHLKQSAIIAEKERVAGTLDPGLIRVLLEHKIDLLFNRQLRFNQQVPAFKEAIMKSNAIVGNDFIQIWVEALNLKLTQLQLQAIFSLALENFYLRLNEENFTREWLLDYFNELNHTLKILES